MSLMHFHVVLKFILRDENKRSNGQLQRAMALTALQSAVKPRLHCDPLFLGYVPGVAGVLAVAADAAGGGADDAVGGVADEPGAAADEPGAAAAPVALVEDFIDLAGDDDGDFAHDVANNDAVHEAGADNDVVEE
jgi:hypothetical protein